MKVIYDKKTGYIYTTSLNVDVDPAVLDVEVPAGQLLARISVDGKEPRPEFYKDKTGEAMEELKQKLEELNAKQQTTDLALAELTMNAMQ